MKSEVTILPQFSNRKPEVTVHRREHPDQEAALAMSLMEKWGMVAALPDGEDKSGRQRLALQSPEQVVDRACAVAELAFDAFRRRGWMIDLPSFAEAVEIATNGAAEDESRRRGKK